MRSRPVAAFAALLLGLLLPGAAPAQKAAYRPQNYILVIDISGSMSRRYVPSSSRLPRGADRMVAPNDPQGLRWDGVQLVLDVAGPEDRVALVVYRGDAVVVTLDVPNNSGGFLELDKKYAFDYSVGGRKPEKVEESGRQVLKRLITDIQALELAKKDEFELPTLGGKGPYKITHGTGSLHALRTVADESRGNLLAAVRGDAERDTWLFLFTDGFEMLDLKLPAVQSPQPQFPLNPVTDFAYATALEFPEGKDERTLKQLADLRELVAERLRPFRDARVPVLTFGLGPDTDRDLLDAIAKNSFSDPKNNRVPAAYHAPDNDALLQQIRTVTWGLRGFLQLTLKADGGKGEDVVRTTSFRPWHDAGVLLYRVGTGPVKALAPARKGIQLRSGGASVERLEPRASRSHLYYSVSAGDPARDEVTDGLTFHVPAAPGWLQAVAALRPVKPLFNYVSPDEKTSYTPLDAIPFRIDLSLPAQFDPKRFDVVATLTRAASATPDYVRLTPADKGEADDAWPFLGEWVPYREGAKPDTVLGSYTVDVHITFRHVALGIDGATMVLQRRSFTVGDYPRLRAKPDRIELTNADAKSITATVKLSLEPPVRAGVRDPERVVARLNVAVTRPPLVSQSKPALALQSSEPSVRAGEATLTVSLPVSAWNGLSADGRTEPGTVEVVPPWSKTGVAVAVEVKKIPYPIAKIDPIIFDLTGRKGGTVTRDVPVALDSQLPAVESVWLGDLLNAKPADAGTELEFRDEAGKLPPVTLKVMGLGKERSVRGAGLPATAFPLSLTWPKEIDIEKGKYKASVHVVGPGVKSAEVPLVLERNALGLDAPDQIVFDLSDRKAMRYEPASPVRLTLESDAETSEVVRLTDGKDAPEGYVVFDPVAPVKESVRLRVEGVGKPVSVGSRGSALAGASYPLAVLRGEKEVIPSGRYRADLRFEGTGLQSSRPVRIELVVDQPYVFLDRSSTPIRELRLAAVAGAEVQRRLAVGLSPDGTNLQSDLRTSLAGLLTLAPGKRTLQLDSGNADQLVVGFNVATDHRGRLVAGVSVPPAVREGTYRLRIESSLKDGKRDLPLVLPVRLQVVHAAALPDVGKDGLFLEPPLDDPCRRQFARRFSLLTRLENLGPDQPVRWLASWKADVKAEHARALQEKTDLIDVATGRSVLKRGDVTPGRDPHTLTKPVELELRVNAEGVPPGQYDGEVTMESWVGNTTPSEKSKSVVSVPVRILVPGRSVVEARAIQGGKALPQVGDEVPVEVTIVCYGCEPGAGELHDRTVASVKPYPLSSGEPAGPASYRFQTKVKLHRAGENRFEVHWPDERCKTLVQAPRPFSIPAAGTIQVMPGRLLGVGEEGTIEARVAPPLGGGPVMVAVRHTTTHEEESVRLVDNGRVEDGDEHGNDGVYSGKYTFGKAGAYRVMLQGNPADGPVGEADAAFEFTPAPRKHTIWYGAGDWKYGLVWLGGNLDTVHVDRVIHFANTGTEPCAWRVKARYPARPLPEARELHQLDAAQVNRLVLTEGVPDTSHLAPRLGVLATTGTLGADGLSGHLAPGQEVTLNLDVPLSDKAQTDLYKPHGKPAEAPKDGWDGLVVELTATWGEGTDTPTVRRLRAPVSVQMQSSTLHQVILAGIGASVVTLVGVVGLVLWRRWRRRAERERDSKASLSYRPTLASVEDYEPTSDHKAEKPAAPKLIADEAPSEEPTVAPPPIPEDD